MNLRIIMLDLENRLVDLWLPGAGGGGGRVGVGWGWGWTIFKFLLFCGV